jgi:hypothetical protein
LGNISNGCKNAFLNGDLHEEVYMHIPSGFEIGQTNGKVLRLCRSLYGLKQSPRAWFDRFRQSMLKRGYIQSNVDHTLFYKHATSKIAILIVYVDDIVITGNDIAEIVDMKKYLAQEFEIKDLEQLKYFFELKYLMDQRGCFYLKDNMFWIY